MISKRIKNMEPSATSAMVAKVAKLKEQGEDVISFSAGQPDFQTPDLIIEACYEAMKAGKTKYELVGGIRPLKEAICEKLRKDNGVNYTPSQICISTGAKQALYNAIMAVCDEGDEVILPIPCWVSYVEMVKLAGGIAVKVATNEDYSLNIDNIKNAVTDKTKLILLNTPNNPTGAVYPKESLMELGKIAVENDIYIITDEVYEKLIYGETEHICIASLSRELYKRCIVINGFSKAFSMTGWRIGYSAASEEITEAIVALQSNTTSNSTSFVQWAAIEALKKCDENIEEMRREFQKRRDYMWQRLNDMPGIKCAKPEGAFYLMPNIESYFGKSYGEYKIESASNMCEFLLMEGKIGAVPGEAFYDPAAIRFAYAVSMEEIKEGMDRMEKALALLS